MTEYERYGVSLLIHSKCGERPTRKTPNTDTFHRMFAEEIVEQDSEFYMGSLDLDFFFTNMSLEEAIDILTNKPFANTERVEG